jgi:hypothetical protein
VSVVPAADSIPERRSAIPTTIPNRLICEANWLMLSAFVSAVSLIQTCRAPFCTGCLVVGSIAANSALLVPPPTSSCDFGVPGFAW